MSLESSKKRNNSNRVNLSKISSISELPNLIEIQTKTYDWFKTKGIQQLFDDFFPVYDQNKSIILKLNKWNIEKPRRNVDKAREESKTYEAAIQAELSLTISKKNVEIFKEIKVSDDAMIQAWVEQKIGYNIKLLSHNSEKNVYFFDTSNQFDKRSELEIIVQQNLSDKLVIDYTIWKTGVVFFGDIPLMTDKGTFIINGSEKVIVSQLLRSPGAYYNYEIDSKNGYHIYNGDLIPARGGWIEAIAEYKKQKINAKNKKITFDEILNVKIDKSRKSLVSSLFTALGMSKNEILEIFDDNQIIKNTYENDSLYNDEEEFHEIWEKIVQDIYKKIRSGETTTVNGAGKFLQNLLFDSRKYDLTAAGRFKLKQKLSLRKRVLGTFLAEDVKDNDNNIIFQKDTKITKNNIDEFMKIISQGSSCRRLLNYEINMNLVTDVINPENSVNNTIEKIRVYTDERLKQNTITIIGINSNSTSEVINIPDIIALISNLLNLMNGIGTVDDIDHLGNRRVRTTGELLQNQLRIGLLRIEKNLREKLSIQNEFKIRPNNIINNKPLTAVIGEFFNLSQLSQFMDQTNPLAELTNKRRLTALGPAGLSRERAGLDVRDVHYSHYGRICPIETPEGPNIGLINNLATYAKINDFGFITTPYRVVKNGKVLDEIRYLTADDENDFVIAQASTDISNGQIVDETVTARYQGETVMFQTSEVDFIDVSPKQIVSIATSCIPFLENDDANRALMGANMQRQAIPLINPKAPLVGTGVEYVAAKDSGLAIVSKHNGIIDYVSAKKIVIKDKENKFHEYKLKNFERSNQGTSITHSPLINKGDSIKKGDIIADGPSMEKGELALGQNVLVAFTTWNGFNYEDAIIISNRLVKEDVFTSVHIEEYIIERRQTKLGPEEITREVPNVSESMLANLGPNGVIKIGSEVKSDDILVGKVTPKGQSKLSPEDKLLQVIFGEKLRNVKDTSLRLPNGTWGTIQDVKYFSKDSGYELSPDIHEIIKVYVAQKRKIQEGDKMSGRHGNKGIISKILPQEDMPFLEDGTPVDIMLNPLGVPSRMNIGQILEIHLGMAAKNKNIKVSSPVFEGLKNEDFKKFITSAGVSDTFKTKLIDGRTGEPFDQDISVGIMYMLKLSHMVDDKIHTRSIGPYSLITQQPLGGKAQNGGQRFGEMEVWALEAYGVAHILREILTIKSDDIIGRVKTYEAIVRGTPIPNSGIPESFNVLTKELQGLGCNIDLIDETGQITNVNNYNKQNYAKDNLKKDNTELEDNYISTNDDSLNSNKKIDSDENNVNIENNE